MSMSLASFTPSGHSMNRNLAAPKSRASGQATLFAALDFERVETAKFFGVNPRRGERG
jgi:hypothetical protein